VGARDIRREGALVVVCLVLAACGSEPGGPPAAGPGQGAPAAESFGSEDVGLGSSLAQIRGHHRVSVELYERGDREGAAIHASHPVAEILDSIRGELDEVDPGLAGRLDRVLEQGVKAVADGVSPARLASVYERAGAVTAAAEAAAVGADPEAAYTGSVIAALLGTAGHEYDEAVAGESIALLVEYQDGYAFVNEAHAMYRSVAADVRSAAPEEAAEIEAAWRDLARALPSPQPPARPAPVDDVALAADLIGAELAETVGARLGGAREPAQVAAEIEELLAEVVAAYRAGDPEEAGELAAEAYLENYEVIEAEVIELAPEVNQQLEPLLGAELRKRIREGAPAGEIAAMVARAEKLLGRALEALEHGGH
jgi:hypothetical protein